MNKRKIGYNALNLFPDPRTADEEGVVAVGGNLKPVVLLEAYSKGIFPWYDRNSPILWWCPDPRLILFPEKFKASKSLRQTIKNKSFEIKTDTNFPAVISKCARIRRDGQDGTWITLEMEKAYIELHKQGYAHSIETYLDGKLVGGLYGVSLGHAFFGESMFHLERDASKVAFYHLAELAKQWNFDFIDAQNPTDHLKSLGAEEIARNEFLNLLEKALQKESYVGKWKAF